MTYQNLVYVIVCLCFTVILGSGIYEHTAIWPHAFSEPPRSLKMFLGNFQLNSDTFWTFIHTITLVLFLIALKLNWTSAWRLHLLIPLVVYAVLLIATFTYFVPELIKLISTQYSDTIDTSLQYQSSMWIKLSLFRLFIILSMSIFLLMGLTKPSTSQFSNPGK